MWSERAPRVVIRLLHAQNYNDGKEKESLRSEGQQETKRFGEGPNEGWVSSESTSV